MHRCSITAVTVLFTASAVLAQDLRVGVGRADITPTEPIWLAGYAGRKKPSEGVESKLWAKAIAVADSTGAVTVIATADTIGFPREFTEEIAGRLERELKIPRERFLLAASHSHAAPVIHGGLTGMYEINGLTGRHAEVVAAYTKMFSNQVFAAAEAAVKDLGPARLSFGRGTAGFAANRRQFGPRGVGFGVNPNGAVDHDVPVLRVERPNGTVKAVVFGYACHCTTLGPDFSRVTGDWAGFAQEHVEAAFPGATALFITGAGADANPNPRGKIEYARAHGLQLAGAVSRVLSEPMAGVGGPVKAVFERVDLPISKLPSKEEWEKKATDKSPWTSAHAKKHLAMMAKGEKIMTSYPCPVQVVRFGRDLTLVAIGGELVVDYALRLKRELPNERLWVAGYTNDVFAYVPSMRILTEGGYEADFNLIYYDIPVRFAPETEDLLVRRIHEMVKKTGI
jgi:hypothetical protein